MRAKTKTFEDKNENFVLGIVKGTLIALCVSLVGILVFAFLLRFTSISEKLILPINEVIKGVSVFLGTFLGFKKQKKMGLLGGLLIGFIYTFVAFVCFSALNGSFNFDKTLLTDMVFNSIIGAICGIICVNIKKSSK